MDKMLSLFNNEMVVSTMNEGLLVPQGPKFAEKLLQMTNDALMFCMVEDLSGEFVGVTGFFNAVDMRNRRGKFGVSLLPQFWHKGYGREITEFMVNYAFNGLGLHRVELEVYEGNDRALKLYQDMGFIEEGRMRKVLWTHGVWRDITIMSILDEEWYSRKSQ